jgi:hypothetical protein
VILSGTVTVLAARLEVEAPHVTRQVQRLEKVGCAARGADPDDRRAQLIQLTPSGMAGADGSAPAQARGGTAGDRRVGAGERAADRGRTG